MSQEEIEQEVVETVEPEEVEQVEEVEVVEDGETAVEVEQSAEPEPAEEPEFTFEGEETQEEKGASWVTELRRQNREQKRRLKELERQIEAGQRVDDIGPRPSLSDDDIDYDTDLFEQKLLEWTAKKQKKEAQQAEIEKANQERQEEMKARFDAYQAGKSKHSKATMEEAESVVVSAMSEARQAMLMDVADDSATLVVALSKNEGVLQRLASIKSDGQFIKELVKLEGKLQMNSSKAKPPEPERRLSTGGRAPGQSKDRLAELEAEAEKTGDWQKYYDYKRKTKA